jgi:hypothetical protein
LTIAECRAPTTRSRDGREQTPAAEATTDDTYRSTQLAPIRHPQQDFFLAQMFNAAPKDDQASMKHPMFSLSKAPDLKMIFVSKPLKFWWPKISIVTR